MGYTNANDILPHNLLCAIQQYIEGEYVYIPRKETKKQPWGTSTGARQAFLARNREIAAKRRTGCSVTALAEQYFLSAKTIYKIINSAEGG